MKSGLIRAFVALPIPALQREALARYSAACAQAAPDLRWVPAPNLHLTLRFLGSREPEVLDALQARLGALQSPRFELELGGLGTFGGQRARVVWIGLTAGQAAAQSLAAQVEAACEASGLEPEPRPLRAHLTLARSRERGGVVVPRLPPLPGLAGWSADSFVLYRSRLGKGPAQYEELATYPLLPGLPE